jgi:hypothetical protein
MDFADPQMLMKLDDGTIATYQRQEIAASWEKMVDEFPLYTELPALPGTPMQNKNKCRHGHRIKNVISSSRRPGQQQQQVPRACLQPERKGPGQEAGWCPAVRTFQVLLR